MKLRIGIVISIIAMIGVNTATEIRFSPDTETIQSGCLVVADIIIDTQKYAVAATDVVIETDLEYIDFVPSQELFPYFFPPKVQNNIIHIVGFINTPKNTITGSGSIGKIFLRQKNSTDTSGFMKLFFAGPAETYDSNLSVLGGIDVLDRVGNATYVFAENAECRYPADYDIVGGFSHMSAEEALEKTIKNMKSKERITNLLRPRNSITFAGILILLLLGYLYYKQQQKGKTS